MATTRSCELLPASNHPLGDSGPPTMSILNTSEWATARPCQSEVARHYYSFSQPRPDVILPENPPLPAAIRLDSGHRSPSMQPGELRSGFLKDRNVPVCVLPKSEKL